MEKFRRKRFELFMSRFNPRPGEIVLDVGAGRGEFLETFAAHNLGIVGLDISKWQLAELKSGYPEALLVCGDAARLPFKNGSVDIAVSNSVIEHLEGFEQMSRMASEIRRVAKRYLVQTPSRYFPIEPHFLLPFFQFVPIRIKRWLNRRFRLGHYPRGALNEDNPDKDNPRLLSARQLRKLFPEARIVKEKFLFMTKSLVAVK